MERDAVSDASFGRWLRRRRKTLDLTQDALAEQVGCSVATIRKIETDERRPSRQIAELLAAVLAIAADERPLFLQVARGERRPERLVSVPAPTEGRVEFTPRAPSSRLPIPLTPLIGRATELAEVGHLLTRAECRLLTLVGPGGIGKTRLAVAAAAEQRDAFPDGVFFVALAPLSAPEFIAPAIAEAIGFAFFGPLEPKTQLLNYLRQKALLLVLDNIEHLLDGVDLISELLQYAPRTKLLATSRERLSLQGEWVLDLQGLPVPSVSQIDQLETYSAITLFVERAQRVRSSFTFSTRNHADVVRICRLVDGLPLGIELAATWIPTLSCQEIAQQIEHDIDFLTVSMRDLPERHRSIHAVFDQSWKLLTREERQVLQRLSVFRGGFTREAAEQVAGASLGVLSALVGKSLLRRTAQGRYDLHELVRQYVGRQLAAAQPDHDATNARFSHYYGDWLQRQEARLFSAEQRATFELITAEMDNVRAALTWAVTHQDWASLEKSFGTLYFFYEMSCRLDEAIATLEQWIAALRQVDAQTASSPDYQIALGYALAVLGWFCPRAGQMDRARAALEQSLGLLRAQHAPHALAYALGGTGALHFVAGDFAQCEQYMLESLQLYRTLGRDHWMGSCHHFLSYALLPQGRLAEAQMHSSEALRLLKVMDETWATIRVQTQLAAVLSAQGNLPEAEQLAHETLALSRAVNDPWSEAQTLTELGGLALRQGQLTEAQRQLRESITVFKMLADDWSLARSLNRLGDALRAAGDSAEAWETFREAYRVAQQAQVASSALDAACGLADVLAQNGANEAALDLLTHILSHPFSSQEAKDRAEQRHAEVVAQLTPQQIEAAHTRAQAKAFEVVAAEILSAQ